MSPRDPSLRGAVARLVAAAESIERAPLVKDPRVEASWQRVEDEMERLWPQVAGTPLEAELGRVKQILLRRLDQEKALLERALRYIEGKAPLDAETASAFIYFKGEVGAHDFLSRRAAREEAMRLLDRARRHIDLAAKYNWSLFKGHLVDVHVAEAVRLMEKAKWLKRVSEEPRDGE